MASTSAVAQIMAKVARNATQLGLTLTSQSASSVVVHNASNDITITYVAAAILAPMGGVDNTVSPYLGLGIVNPGQLQMQTTSVATDTVADVIDSTTAATVLKMLGGFANDLILKNGDGDYTATLRGDVDLLGMGQ